MRSLRATTSCDRRSQPLVTIPDMRFLALVLIAGGSFPGVWAQDRQVAEWTLFMGGAVRVKGGHELIRDVAALPDGNFELEVLDWVGMNVDPPSRELPVRNFRRVV